MPKYLKYPHEEIAFNDPHEGNVRNHPHEGNVRLTGSNPNDNPTREMFVKYRRDT